MKITELLNESERLDELVPGGVTSRILSKMFGGAAEVGANVVGKGAKARLIDGFAQRIARGEKLTIADVARDAQVAKKEATALLAKAQSKANVLTRTANFQANIAGLGQTASSVKKWTSTILNVGLTGAYYWMFYEPLRDYMEHIEAAEEKLKAGGGVDPTPEDFEAYRRKEMSILIGRWTTLWATGKLVKLPFSIVSKLVGKLSPGLASAVSTLGRGGQVYFMSQINSPENAKTIASWMAGPIASQFIGGAGVAGENLIRSWIPGAKEYDQPEGEPNPGTAAGAEDDQEVDGTTQQADPNKPKPEKPGAKKEKQPWKPEEWEYYSPGIYRNKKTYELDRRDNYL